jgi:transposase-like protein
MAKKKKATRQKFTELEKIEAIKEAAQTGNAAEVARRRGIKVTTLYGWKKQFSHEEISETIGNIATVCEACLKKDALIEKQRKIINVLMDGEKL